MTTEHNPHPRSGYVMSIELFVPCHTSEPESMTKAAEALKALQDHDWAEGLKVDGIAVESFAFKHVNKRAKG